MNKSSLALLNLISLIFLTSCGLSSPEVKIPDPVIPKATIISQEVPIQPSEKVVEVPVQQPDEPHEDDKTTYVLGKTTYKYVPNLKTLTDKFIISEAGKTTITMPGPWTLEFTGKKRKEILACLQKNSFPFCMYSYTILKVSPR